MNQFVFNYLFIYLFIFFALKDCLVVKCHLLYASFLVTQCPLSYIPVYFWHLSSQLDIDDCVNHTCSNGGSCVDGVNNYSCKCMPGFTGDRCQTGGFVKNYQQPIPLYFFILKNKFRLHMPFCTFVSIFYSLLLLLLPLLLYLLLCFSHCCCCFPDLVLVEVNHSADDLFAYDLGKTILVELKQKQKNRPIIMFDFGPCN